MKKNMTKTICLAAAALVLTLGLTVGTAMAYFTTYATGKGGVQLDLGFTKTEIDEDVVAGKKEIVLKNLTKAEGGFDCYVRLKVLVGDAYKGYQIKYIEHKAADGESRWTPGAEGYYYFTDILVPGGETTQLDIDLNEILANTTNTFNVIVIQENAPVIYDDEGKPDFEASWAAEADISQTIIQ